MQSQQTVTIRQSVCMLSLFMVGSSVVLSSGREAGRDIWIAIILALVLSLPLALLYGRLIQLYPNIDIFDMQLYLFGPIFGRITSLIFILFSFHLGALVIRNFTEFIQVESFEYIPQFLFAVPLGLLSIWCLRAGIATLSRWSILFFPVFIIIIIIIALLSIDMWKMDNLTPILHKGLKPVITGSIDIISFPFLETSILLYLFKPLEKPKRAIKLFLVGFTVCTAALLLILTRNILVLDTDANKLYFPSYDAVSLVNIAQFIQGIEALVIAVFLLGGFVKITTFLYVTCLGLSKLISVGNYRSLASPIGLLMISFSLFVSNNVMDMYDFAAHTYKYYVLPVGLFIPLLLWISAEIKTRKESK